MTKEQLSKTINALKNISIDFNIEYVVFEGYFVVRGLVLNNPDDVSRVKSIIENEILKQFKFRKSKAWYLGDQKEVVLMQLKENVEMEISELEEFQISNYA